jgi:putative NADH-flavin reductase
MKILSLGANGAVGQLALDDLLRANHEVTALVRDLSTMQTKDPRLTIVRGEPTNAAELEDVLAGQEVVLSTLGARANKKTTLRADVARNRGIPR